MKPLFNPALEQLYLTTELWFTDKLADFAELVTDKLVSKAEQSTITSVQTHCFSAIHSIRSVGSRSIACFMESLKKNFQSNTIKPDLNDDLYAITHKRKNPLDLLTTKDLEDSLSYETAIEKLHKNNKEAFEHLEVRIYELLKPSRETITNNPISSESIITAFRESLDLFDFSSEIRIEVYELFEKFMDSQLPELLQTLNNQLINEGILPEIDPNYFIKKLSRQHPSGTPQAVADNNQVPASEPLQEPGLPVNPYTRVQPADSTPGGDIPSIPQQGHLTTAAATGGGGQNLSSRLMNLANRLSSPGAYPGTNPETDPETRVPTTQQNISEDIPDNQPVNPIPPADNSQAQINSLLGYTTSGQYSSADNSLRSLRESYMDSQNKSISSLITSSYNNQYDVSTDELVQAVINIRNSSPDYQQLDSTNSIAQKIREEVLSGVNKSSKSTELKNKRLFLIDMIETLFDHICNNKNLSPTAIHLFRQLTIPVIHLSLIDDAFIDSSEHPARLFLEDFADAALGISDDEDSQNNYLYLKLHKIIELASQEERINSSFFSELHDDLKRFIQSRKQQANIKSPSSRIQIEKKIDAIILYHTQNRDVPDNLLLILNKVWKKVMLNTYFDDNYNDDDWEKSKAFIDTLINSIRTVKTDIEYKRLERLLPVLRQEFEDGLIQINLPFNQKIKLLQYFDILHKNALSYTEQQTEAQASPDEEIAPADNNTIEEEVSTEVIEEIISAAEQLETAQENPQDALKENVISLISSEEMAKADAHSLKLSVTDYELIRISTLGYQLKKTINDQFTDMVKQLEVDDWIEFRFESRYSRAKITWISDDKTQFNCLTQNNQVVEMTLNILSHSFRHGVATLIAHHSIIEDAIAETASTLAPDSHHEPVRE